jgi:non-ribosomal peptide synthetase component F
VIALPTDRPREEAATYRGAAEAFTVPGGVVEGLRRICRQERSTPFMALLAAFNVLLSRWTGQKDLVVGTDLANRDQPETEGLIGFLLNHLVLRTDLSGDPSYREVLRRVREEALSAYVHQDVPFDRLVEALRPERSVSHTPIFQVLCVVEKAGAGTLQLNGLEQLDFELECNVSKFDLSLFITELDDELLGAWVYRTDLFDASTIRALSEEFQALLAGLLAQPDAPVEDVETCGTTPGRDAGGGATPAASGIRGARRRAAAGLADG